MRRIESKKYRKKTPIVDAVQAGGRPDFPTWLSDAVDMDHKYLTIRTIDGLATANFGDWIIRVGAGQFLILTPALFKLQYEAYVEPPMIEIDG